MLASGCETLGAVDSRPAPVVIPTTCEDLAQTVPHAQVDFGKTHAVAALRREAGQLDKANENLSATYECQRRQRLRLGQAS